MSNKYTESTAQTIALRIYNKYGPQIARVSADFLIPAEYLAGLTGMENPNCNEFPAKTSYRFEKGVYEKLIRVRDGFLNYKYNNITKSMLKDLSNETIYNLSVSWGQTQIMGYYVLSVLKGATVADLRNPKLHYGFCAKFLLADERMRSFLKKRNFAQICHIWNSGKTWDGTTSGIKTHSPYYMYNCQLVANKYKALDKSSLSVVSVAETPQPISNHVTVEPNRADNSLSTSVIPRPDITVLAEEGPIGEDIMIEQNEIDREVEGTLIERKNPITDIIVPGYQTSQGQMTVAFAVVAFLLSFLGFNYSTVQVENVFTTIVRVLEILGPLLMLVPVLNNYINSRGKIQSNAIWATASTQQGEQLPPVELAGLGRILGGKNWKDPQRYINIGKVAGEFVPGVGQVIDKIDGDDNQRKNTDIEDLRAVIEMQNKQIETLIALIKKTSE